MYLFDSLAMRQGDIHDEKLEKLTIALGCKGTLKAANVPRQTNGRQQYPQLSFSYT